MPLSPEELDRLMGRNGEWWRLHVEGRTQDSIAKEYGVDPSTVSRALKQVRDSIPETVREDEITRSLEFLHQLQAGAMEIYRLTPAPVTVGKDGDWLYDPEKTGPDGKPLLVRDYSMRIRAGEYALKIQESARKLLGLDAAQRVDHTVSGERAEAERLAKEAADRVAGDS